MKRMSVLPRWIHRAWAFGLGYFWLPCPLCGRYSGGHEWKDRDGFAASVPIEEYSVATETGPCERGFVRHGICPACTREGWGGSSNRRFIALRWPR